MRSAAARILTSPTRTIEPERSVLDAHDGLLLDLDGVVYIGPDPVPGAVESVIAASEAGLSVGYVTNNASRPAGEVAHHLAGFGLPVSADDVTTSAQVAAELVRRRCGEGAVVLAVGGPGVSASLLAAGLRPVTSLDEHPVAVVQGYGPQVGWQELAEAAYAVQAGSWWVATNRDETIPTPRGTAPGNGAFIAAVRMAVAVDPVVAGKPEPVAFVEAAARIGAERPLVIGDRLDTDIEGAVAANMDSLLVLTGVHGILDAAQAPPSRRPSAIAVDLGALSAPAVPVRLERTDGQTPRAARCGEARASAAGGELRVDEAGDPVDAAAAAIAFVWACADTGRAVRIDPELAGSLDRRVRRL